MEYSIPLGEVAVRLGAALPRDQQPWWHHPKWSEAILRPIVELGLLPDDAWLLRGESALQLERETAMRVRILDFPSLRAALPAKGAFLVDDPDDIRRLVHPTKGMGGLAVNAARFPSRTSADERAGASRAFTSLLDRWAETLSTDLVLGTAFIGRTHFEHPQPWPPVYRRFSLHALEILDRRLYETRPPGDLAIYDQLRDAPLPEGVHRRVDGPLLRIQWAEDYFDDAHLRERLALEALWYARVVKPERREEYNELGDRHWIPAFCVPKPPLTYYAADPKLGIKAIVVDRHGGVDEELFAEMAGWVAAKRLPDGTPLASLGLLVNTREGAIAVRDRLRAMSTGPLLWVDGAAKAWQIDPPGMWLKPGTDEHARCEAMLPEALRRA